MKEINTEDYRVTGTEKLSEIDTYEDFNESEKKLKKELKNIRKVHYNRRNCSISNYVYWF